MPGVNFFIIIIIVISIYYYSGLCTIQLIPYMYSLFYNLPSQLIVCFNIYILTLRRPESILYVNCRNDMV